MPDLPASGCCAATKPDVFREYELALRVAARRRAFVRDAIDDARAVARLQFLRRQPDRATASRGSGPSPSARPGESTVERRDAHLVALPA